MKKTLSLLLFSLVALLSFSVWAVGSRFYSSEIGLYANCALIFLGLGGAALLPAADASGGKAILLFCLRFALGFVVYAAIWSTAWFTFRGSFGEIAGSALGLLGMLAIFRPARVAALGLTTATAVAFFWHSLGYYAGDFAYQTLQGRGPFPLDLPMEKQSAVMLARFSWGLFYGLGLGGGLVGLVQPARP